MKNGFFMYTEYGEKLDILSDEQLGKLIRALLEYLKTGQASTTLDQLSTFAFQFISKDIEHDKEINLRRSENRKNKTKQTAINQCTPYSQIEQTITNDNKQEQNVTKKTNDNKPQQTTTNENKIPSLDNNINNNILLNNNYNNKLNNNISLERERENIKGDYKGEKESKTFYGILKNVSLSPHEIDMLKEKFPSNWDGLIDRLSLYLESSGRTYQSHLAVLLRWGQDDVRQQVYNRSSKSSPSPQNENKLSDSEVESRKRYAEQVREYLQSKKNSS